MKHTPTPWELNINSRYPIYSQHTREDVRHICSIVQNETTTAEEKDANLEFIVRACNAHDELVAALKECTEALQAELGLDERYKIEAIQDEALERAEQLLKRLAKAEGR